MYKIKNLSCLGVLITKVVERDSMLNCDFEREYFARNDKDNKVKISIDEVHEQLWFCQAPVFGFSRLENVVTV